MTLTLTDNTSLLIQSDYQDALNQSVTLSVTLNCTTTYTDISIPPGDTDYTLLPETLATGSTEFTDGVYTIKITTVQENSDIVVENKCILIDPSLECDMMDILTDLTGDTENIVKALSYHALSYIPNCDTCSCSKWCLLYNTVTETPCDATTLPCGCN